MCATRSCHSSMKQQGVHSNCGTQWAAKGAWQEPGEKAVPLAWAVFLFGLLQAQSENVSALAELKPWPHSASVA